MNINEKSGEGGDERKKKTKQKAGQYTRYVFIKQFGYNKKVMR